MSPGADSPSKPSTTSCQLNRVSGRNVEDALKLLNDNGLLRDGRVNIISLEPIAERLAERWERKREDVWRHAERFLRRQFRDEDLIVLIDEATVLIAQPGRDPLIAQTLCVRAATELIGFFIGETTAGSIRVKQVEAVEEDRLIVSAVDPRALQTGLPKAGPAVGRPARVQRTPLLTRLGRDISVTVSLEQLWRLQPTAHKIAHHAHVRLHDGATGSVLTAQQRAKLQPGELADVDIAVLKAAVAMRAASPKLMGGLIIPVSYLTLTSSSTRYQLLEAVQRLQPTERRTFGFEMVDLEDGVPAGRLAELVSLARGQSRGVVCRLGLTAANAEKAHAAGSTLSVEAPDAVHTEVSLLQLEGPMAAALKIVRAVILHDVPANLLPVAGFVAATHCTAAPARV